MSSYPSDVTAPPDPSAVHAGGEIDQGFFENFAKTINQAHKQRCRQGFATVFTGTKPRVDQGSTTTNIVKFYAPVPSTQAVYLRVRGLVTVTSASTSVQEISLSFSLKGDNVDSYTLQSDTATLYLNPSSSSSSYFEHLVLISQGASRPDVHQFVQIVCDFTMDAAVSGDFAELNQISVHFQQQDQNLLEPFSLQAQNSTGLMDYTGYPIDAGRTTDSRALSSGQAWTWKRTIQAIRKMPRIIASMSAIRDVPSTTNTSAVSTDVNFLGPYPHIHFCRVPDTDKDIMIKAYVETLNGNVSGRKVRLCAFDIASLLSNAGPSPDFYTRDISQAEVSASIPYTAITNATSFNMLQMTMPVPSFTFNAVSQCRFIAVGIAVDSTLYKNRFGDSTSTLTVPRIVSYGIWYTIDD